MTGWGVCTTLNATREQVLAFVAHHLDLGADHIWLHFDDPDAPAADLAMRLPRTTVIRCDAAYWQALPGGRPDTHQNRQTRNIQRVCAEAALPWIAHLDHDEFLLADRPVAGILDDVPQDRLLLRVAPFEALHDPALPDDIFTARQFRAPLRGPHHAADRAALFGNHAALMPDGVLSHSAGKCFFRTGIRRMRPRIHGAFRANARVAGGAFHPDLALLHFHAQDRAQWLDRLAFRLAQGGYRDRPLHIWLAEADAAARHGFYDAVQVATPDKVDLLRQLGLLREVDLGLRAKVGALTAGMAGG